MTDEEDDRGGDVATRTVVLFVPIVLTARLFGLWAPKSVAWAASMVIWLLVIYWLPTRTNLSLRRWLIVVAASAAITFLVGVFQPDLL